MAQKTFDEVVLFARTGLNPRKNFKLGCGTNKYITIKNIHNNKLIIDDNTDTIDDAAVSLIHRRSQIKKGDILFCSIGRMGDMFIIDEEPNGWDINESVFAFTLDTNLIRQKYFYYKFKHRETLEFLSKNSSGSTFKSIKMNQLKQMKFELPSLTEQDYIVNTLDNVVSIIEARQHELLKLDELIKARFVEMFVGKGFKDKPVHEVLEAGFWLMPATPEFIENGDIPYITSKNIKGGMIDFENVKYISKEAYESISANRPTKIGDILVSMIGTLGQIAVITDERLFYGQNLYLLRLNNAVVNTVYFCEFFNSDETQHELLGKRNQSTQAYLKANHVEDLVLPVPPLYMQNEFATFVEQVDKSKVVIQKSLDETQLLFDSLMQKYFG